MTWGNTGKGPQMLPSWFNEPDRNTRDTARTFSNQEIVTAVIAKQTGVQ